MSALLDMCGLPRGTDLLLSWPGMKPLNDDDLFFLYISDLVQAVEYREQHFHTTVLCCHRRRRGNRKRAILVFRSAKEVPHL